MKPTGIFPSLLIALSAASCVTTLAQIDNFDDGNAAEWTEFSPLDVVGVSSIFSFPDSSSGGKGYRLQSPAPPVPNAGPARSFTYRAADEYTDFYAGVDVVDWNNEVNQAFGFLFRASNVGLGETVGYVLNYDPQQASGGRGQIQFNIVTGEADQGTIGAANISFEPGRRYRIVMRAEGERFSADVFDLNNLTSPIVSYWGTDDQYPSGAVGLFNFYRGGDTTNPDAGIADTTFDNYTVAATNDRIAAPGAWRGIEGWPHVLGLSPLNRTAYHPADSGISFSISTLDDQAVASDRVKLSLNGRDVTSGLAITPDGNNLAVQYSGLGANTVYDARLEISQPDRAAAVTEWTFDTFSEDYLTSDVVEVIEIEDYNFDGGKFIDNPPPSGFLESGAGVNTNEGYVDREGEPGVDFFDYEETPATEDKNIYRSFDPVATQAGASETGSATQFSGPDPAVNDTLRNVFGDRGLTEFQVTNTEGGEWLNYTREFPEGNYNVYLRAAGRASQALYLDDVTSNASEPDQTTERLGTFHLPNMGMEFNYRFVPLVDDAGNPVQLSLGGEKTVRLSIGEMQENRTNETTALNYLAFVPAVEPPAATLEVTVADTIAGPFSPSATVQVTDSQITLPIAGPQQFIRITRSGSPVTITRIANTAGSLVIDIAP